MTKLVKAETQEKVLSRLKQKLSELELEIKYLTAKAEGTKLALNDLKATFREHQETKKE